MSSRRDVLAGAGTAGAAALAGCQSRSSVDVDTRVDSAGWPLVHHDTLNTNRNPHATPPRSASSERWSVRLHAPDADAFGGYAFAPFPAVVGDRVYVGGESLSCHNADDGTVRWSATADGPYHGVGASGNAVYVVTGGGHPSSLAVLGRDGTRRWTREYDTRYLASAPLVAGGVAFLAAQEGVVAVDAADGRARWSLDGGSLTGLPAVDRTARYTTTDHGYGVAARPLRRGLLARLRGRPPSTRWSASLDGDLWEPPAVGPERLYVATNRGTLADAQEAGLHAVSTAGEVEWSRSVAGRATSPVVGDTLVFQRFGTNPTEVDYGKYRNVHYDARVVAHDVATGAVEWERTAPGLGDWRIEPVLAGGTLYVPLHDGRDDTSLLRAYDAETGTVLRTETLDAPAVHLAAVGDALYVTTHDGVLRSLV